MKKSHYPQKYTDSYGIVHEFQKNNSQPEKNHIDFKNFKKGDKVVITFDEGGKEKNLFVKITSISLDKKVIHFETDDFEYECRFSEIKEITKPNKMNVVFWIYSAIVPLLCICILLFHIANYSHDYKEYSSTLNPYLYLIIAVWNILLFSLSKKNLTQKGTCLWMVILNCMLIFYTYTFSVPDSPHEIFSPVKLFSGLLLWFAFPQQFFLQWYIFFKEVLHKENPSFLLCLFLGIVTGIFYFLLLRTS